jgi:RimJ/RimL family protein N-acetyltransferase
LPTQSKEEGTEHMIPGDAHGPAYRVETARLVVRCWQPADAPLLQAAWAASWAHLSPWMPWARGEPNDLETTIALTRHWRGTFDLGQDFVYGVFSPDEREVLGGSGLHTRAGEGAREIGYWIHVDQINRGLATELAGALTRVGFEVDGLRRVEIHCVVQNVRSAAVARKLGYVHEGTLRARVLHGEDEYRDKMVWTLLRDEYPDSPAASTDVAAFDVMGRRLL